MKIKKIVTIMLVLFCIKITYAQNPNKTLADTIFKVGDVIKLPRILYAMCCRGCPVDGIDYNTKDTIKLIGNFLTKHPNLIVQIENHSDTRGSAEKNLKLTTDRSTSLKKHLETFCFIDSTRLFSKGYGETQPLVLDADILKAKTKEQKENLHAINRRTVLKVIAVK